jgi:hypothetical protein
MDKEPDAGEETFWHVFAGIITGLLGVFNAVEGLFTLFNNRYGGSISSALFFFNLRGWGWLHLLLGIALLAVAVGLLAEMDWAPAIAVGLAGATAIFQMIYINIIPTWSLVNVALALFLIYLLVVKGRETLRIPPLTGTGSSETASSKGNVKE